MNNIDLDDLDVKLTKSFGVLGFKKADLETIRQKVFAACSADAISALIEKDNNLRDKFKTLSIKDTESLKMVEAEDFLTENQKNEFIQKFKSTLEGYLSQLLDTVSSPQKEMIGDIWK